jgi:tetratricopeptide (TPR) repeat protein
MTKRSRKKEKNLSSHRSHFNFLDKIVHPLTGEASKTTKIAICIFLVVATFAAYSQVQDHEFLNYDDNRYVTKNVNVKAGLTSKSISWAFTTLHDGHWFPMTWLSHMLDYQLYGLNPKGHLLTNLFFHIANALILFMVLLRMTGALWQSGFVAAMFAFHPLNVESVAWVAERKNVLSTLFWLLAMWAYIFYVEKPGIKRYSLVALFFVLGLMSKAMLVTLPFVFLLLDYWPLKRLQFGQEKGSDGITENHKDTRPGILQLVQEKIPLFLISAGLSVVTFIAQGSAGAVQSLGALPLQERVANALVSYWSYLQKMIWPSELSAFYPHPGDSLPVWQGLISAVLLAFFSVGAIRMVRCAPYLVVGWFWYLGTLVPVIGLVQVGAQAMADRYAYVSLIGMFIIIAWGLPELMAKWHHKEKILSISAVILIPILLVTTWVQVGYWKNGITIFKRAIRVTDKEYPSLSIAYTNLGDILSAKRKTGEAIFYYKKAIKLKPGYAEAHYNLGNALFFEREAEEAIPHYKEAIKLKPDYAEAHYNLGNILSAKQKTGEAISHYKEAIKLKPDYAKAHHNLGNALFFEREAEEAIPHYKEAIKLKPDYAKAHYNLGNALLAMRETGGAIPHYKTAVKLKPDYAEAHYNLGNALFFERENEEAIFYYKKAVRLRPNFALAHNNLGNALFQKGEVEEAINHYKEAVRLKPDFVLAHKNLEMALLQADKLEKF